VISKTKNIQAVLSEYLNNTRSGVKKALIKGSRGPDGKIIEYSGSCSVVECERMDDTALG
jgi:hypothetical protein